MSGLTFSNVDAGYGPAVILRDVSLHVAPGERVALLGRNGVGKTTVVNALCGIAALHGGKILIEGQHVPRIRTYLPAQHGIAVVPQGRRILANLSVEENLLLGAATKRPGPWTLARVYNLFPVLRERARNRGTALSGGQQQMLAIGRALMTNPKILILDEPSEGLAPVVVDDVAELLVRLSVEDGIGILLIEQIISLVRRVATRCYVLSKGRIVEDRGLEGWSVEDMQAHILV